MGLIYFLITVLLIGILAFIWISNYYKHLEA
jgi:Tfp pilus assembly protein PilE